MIIIDTNVLSELMKPEPNHQVYDWYNGYDLKSLFLSVISILEIQFGISIMTDGRKKDNLQSSFDEMLKMRFQNRIINFDHNAATETAKIASIQKGKGINTSIQDLQIIGIAIANDAVIATRNEKDFADCGVKIINPWNNEAN